MKKNEINMQHVWDKRCSTGFWWENLKKRDYLEDLGVGARVILKWIFMKWDGGVDWADLAEDREMWRAL